MQHIILVFLSEINITISNTILNYLRVKNQTHTFWDIIPG